MRVQRIPVPRLHSEMNPLAVWSAALVMILAIGWVDFFSGTELRVFPLYYAPISLLAWNLGRTGALVAALLSAAAWLGFNVQAGMQFSTVTIWAANTLVLAGSFAIVGLLISALKDALLRERSLSRTDPLTSLLNRRAFYEEGTVLLSLCQRKKRPLTLAYLDLDNFKALNDSEGHESGDRLLVAVANVLKASTRPSDVCARLGGDEFVVLLPETDLEEARVALERLRLLISEGVRTRSNLVGCSMGAAAYRTPPVSLDEVIAAADAHLYKAKGAGKNRLCLEAPGASQ